MSWRGICSFDRIMKMAAVPVTSCKAIFMSSVRCCGQRTWKWLYTLWWRHNDHDSVSNHQPHECLFNRLFRRRSKKTSKLRVTGLCVGNSQRASYAKKVSIWWRHNEILAWPRLWENWWLHPVFLSTLKQPYCEWRPYCKWLSVICNFRVAECFYCHSDMYMISIDI